MNFDYLIATLTAVLLTMPLQTTLCLVLSMAALKVIRLKRFKNLLQARVTNKMKSQQLSCLINYSYRLSFRYRQKPF